MLSDEMRLPKLIVPGSLSSTELPLFVCEGMF